MSQGRVNQQTSAAAEPAAGELVSPSLPPTLGGELLQRPVDTSETLKGRSFGKAAFDYVVATLTMIGLAPLMLLISAAIRLDSRGPIIFRQARVGLNGEIFTMWKFRTMVEGAAEQLDGIRHLNHAGAGTFKSREDPRVTRVGAILRATHLDELPQLFNVLFGDMSLVGPRPIEPWEESMIDGGRGRMLTIKPGLTGIWQVSGLTELSIPERFRFEEGYRASFWGDIVLLAKTVLRLFRRPSF